MGFETDFRMNFVNWSLRRLMGSCSAFLQSPAGSFTTRPGGDTIVAVKIIIYILTFAIVMVIAAIIVGVSLAVAPAAAKSTGLSVLAVALGGLAVTGGVIYLAEKLINLTKGVVSMVFDLVVEKYKQHRLEAGIKIGIQQGQEIGRKEGRAEAREEQQRAVRAWYERQQAALRAGLPFDEPPPGYSPETHANGQDAG